MSYEATKRREKAVALARYLHKSNIGSEAAATLDPVQWGTLAKAAAVTAPSPATIKEVLALMAERESQELKERKHVTDDQIEIIRKQVAPPGTTDDELALFLAYAKQTGLDPLSRQIYLSERRSNVNGQWVVSRKPEVTIDGFRLVAERTGVYGGQIGPHWCGQDGVWRDVWLSDQPPAAARVGVLRKDFAEPLYAVALWREYAQTTKDGKPNSMWAKYSTVMLAKCAESLALRRAFPRELSGLYTREELSSIDDSPREMQKQVADRKIKELTAGASTPGDMLMAFADMRAALEEEFGSDAIYFDTLNQFGIKSAEDIPDKVTGAKVYKALGAARAAARRDKENRAEAEEIARAVGPDKFWTFAGSEGIDSEAWEAMKGDALEDFLNKLIAEFRP